MISRNLEKDNDYFRSLLESATFGVMSFEAPLKDEDSLKCCYLNPCAHDFLNLPGELESKEEVSDYLSNEQKDFLQQCLEIEKSGNKYSFEWSFGNERWLGVTVMKRSSMLDVTLTDITGYKQARFAVQRVERDYRRLFDESIDPIVITDGSLEIKDANPSFIKKFGKTFESLPQSFEILLDKEAGDNLLRLVESEGFLEEYELKLRSDEGKVLTCLMNFVPVGTERQVEYLGVIRDISKRKKAEQRLVQAEKLTMTGKIARTIAHEFRNPLTNFSLALEQISEDISNKRLEDTGMYLDIIKRNSGRIADLVTDLLNSSKPRELRLQEVRLKDVTHEAVELVSDRLKLNEIVLEQFYDTNGTVMADPEQLKMAILNLLVNATEVVKSGKGKIEVRVEEVEENLHITVSDNGKGIQEEDMPHLFEPFYSAKKDGSGLGLTTVQNIVHAHGAQVEVNSVPGEGTAFVIIFTQV